MCRSGVKIEQWNFKQTIDDFFKDNIITPLSQLAATLPFPNRMCWTSYSSKHTKTTKLDTDAQYEIRLDLPSWKLISPSSLRILYLLLQSVNNSEHCTLCRLCNIAAVWTSVLVIFLKFYICHYTHTDHKRYTVGCEQSIAKSTLLAEQCAISSVSPYLYQHLKHRIKWNLPFAAIIRSSPYSPC